MTSGQGLVSAKEHNKKWCLRGGENVQVGATMPENEVLYKRFDRENLFLMVDGTVVKRFQCLDVEFIDSHSFHLGNHLRFDKMREQDNDRFMLSITLPNHCHSGSDVGLLPFACQ